MADSLASIDPNMENGEEGIAFLRRMYKVYNQKPKKNAYQMPETPTICVKEVAGKVIMVENLQEDTDKALSFRDFFAKVYSEAYVNSLITMRDGLHSLVPGGLDGPIEKELIRIQGETKGVDIAELEKEAGSSFMHGVAKGMIKLDDTSLIKAVDPILEALTIAGPDVLERAKRNLIIRDDYLNDFNFLKYLVVH